MRAFKIAGLTGESPELAALWDLGCLGVQEDDDIDGVSVIAYFDTQRELPVAGTWLELPDTDYVAQYQQTLAPIRFGQLVVAPTHAKVELAAGEVVLWLDPGAAFGSGHHETTGMALTALTRLDLSGRTVLDVGAGSGLLALAADRLGAEHTYGVDIDAATVAVARENGRLNRSRARFAAGTLEVAGAPGHVDVLVANLYAELHQSLFADYVKRVLVGGRIILTGILAARRHLVIGAAPPSARLVGEATAGEWLLLEFEVTRAP